MKTIVQFLVGLLTVIGVVLFWLFGFGFILAFPVMWAWNYVIPTVFGLPTITYMQAFAIYFLFGLLFRQTRTVEKDKK